MHAAAAQATLPGKVHRQYLTRDLNAWQRAVAVINHYRYIDHPTRIAAGARYDRGV